MALRILTNSDHPVALLGTGTSYHLRIALVGPDGRIRPILTDTASRWGHIDIRDADLVEGVYSVPLPVTDDTTPASHYRVEQTQTWTDDNGDAREYYDRGLGAVPAGAGDLLWEAFYTPGTDPSGCADWNAFIDHARDDAGSIPAARHLPDGGATGQVPIRQADGSTEWGSTSGTGDMNTLTYDPTGVAADTFNLANHVGNLDAGTF